MEQKDGNYLCSSDEAEDRFKIYLDRRSNMISSVDFSGGVLYGSLVV